MMEHDTEVAVLKIERDLRVIASIVDNALKEVKKVNQAVKNASKF